MLSKLLTISLLIIIISSLLVVETAKANFCFPPPPTRNAFIRSNGDIEPSTLPIQRFGNTYKFLDCIFNYTLEIQLDNIILDGSGFEFKGINFYTGLNLSRRSNVKIINLFINQFGSGIKLSKSKNIVIERNMLNCKGDIVMLDYCQNIRITSNSISGDVGIYGQATTDTRITDNISIATDGVRLHSSGSNVIENNTFLNSETSIELGFVSECNGNLIVNNTIVTGGTGILLNRGSKNNIIIDNLIAEKHIGITIRESQKNEFRNNFLSNNKIGILMDFDFRDILGEKPSSSNSFIHNIISNTENVQLHSFRDNST